ncbi:MAG: hypothetical protein U0Q16_21020 [Bryobacteraceae bacterium]
MTAEFCAEDSQKNRVCARTKPDSHTCASIKLIAWPPRTTPCNDVVVEKKTPDGSAVYSLTLSGGHDDVPYAIALDSRGNAVVAGSTDSRDFPVTADAFQRTYAGPEPFIGYYYRPPGGDLFISIVSSSGQLVYSTFAGSPSDETEPQITVTGDEIQIVARSGPGFTTLGTPDPPQNANFVFLTFDAGRRVFTGLHYLATPEIRGPANKAAAGSGSFVVAGGEALIGFNRWGARTWSTPIDGFGFTGAPAIALHPTGDIWLTGRTEDGAGAIAAFDTGGIERFRWRPPTVPIRATGEAAPFGLAFAGDGSAYVNISLSDRHLEFTTPNALLHSPCNGGSSALAVLGSEGELRILTYAPPGYHAVAGPSNAPREVDLTTRPKVGCIEDERKPSGQEAFGAGQLVAIRGGGFGPDDTVRASLTGGSRLPRSLAGVRILVADSEAPLFRSGHGDAVFAVPSGVRPGTTPVAVEWNGQRSEEFAIRVEDFSPAVYWSVFNADGVPNSPWAPAAPGSVVGFQVAGAGNFEPALEDGEVATESHRIAESVRVTFTSADGAPAEVVFAGIAAGKVAGNAEVRFRLPAAIGERSISAYLSIGSFRSNLPSIWIQPRNP